MRTQVKAPQIGTFVVPAPLEQWASLWVINFYSGIVEVRGAFSITDASQAHKIVVEGWNDVARLGEV